jgi:hypothetical protein
MIVYSFKDLSGTITHPLMSAPLIFIGQIGLVKITVAMATEKSTQAVGADGTVITSYVAGDNGLITIECEQNSITHSWLLAWYNAVKIQADLGDITNFALAIAYMRNLVAGYSHVASGISIPKLGDKPYAAQAQNVIWALPAADIQNMPF